MPRKGKPITELPDEDAIKKLFPAKVVKEAKKVAHEKDGKPAPKPKKSK